MDVAEKTNGLTTSAFYSLSRNDLLGNILYSDCSVDELLIFGRSPENGAAEPVAPDPAAWWQRAVVGSLPTPSLDHPTIAHRRPAAIGSPRLNPTCLFRTPWRTTA